MKVSIGNESHCIELLDSQKELSADPVMSLSFSDSSIPVSLKDIAALKKMLSKGEELLKARKEQYLHSKNMNLF